MKVTCLSLGLDRSSFEAGLTQSWIGAPIVKHGLVREAGGEITDFHGNPWKLKTSDLLFSNGKVHQEMLNLIHPS
jgi:Archaeal fructose-1,6-bisphosphatase and related enzymes of inositol monophosphatase family